MITLTREEMETHLSLSAQDRIDEKGWSVYTDDPVLINRLNKVATGTPRGKGMIYTLKFNQVSFRTVRELSPEEKERRSKSAREAFGHN